MRLTFQFASPITGILWAAGWKAIEPHSICSPHVQFIYDFLKMLNGFNKLLEEPKVFFSFFPFVFFFHTSFDYPHQQPLPPSSAFLVKCAPWFESREMGELGVGGGNNSTWKWAYDCLPSSLVMEGLSNRAPQPPPWWLISCGALGLRSDTLAHQTPLSLSGTPLIAQCFIIVPHSALVSGATSYSCQRTRSCNARLCCCFLDWKHVWNVLIWKGYVTGISTIKGIEISNPW